ncbi:hypothetical protein OAK47_03670 [Planctomycetaceae bacterium]|nr:hypothetical protein [Planctomycetaceae bacterium]MDC0262301.1 hypothetical protein [Planctomycetaceae bacterium]MDC0273506.1 hypothetical protein [Planctomycetaceae bacterium]MDG2390310.1 hypothetical protein [Planctomycetaceae bacterium]
MRLLTNSLLITFLMISHVSDSDAQETPNESANKPLPFRISKETTYITGPLMKNGLVDYSRWLNQQKSQGVTPETNAAVFYWKAIGQSKEFLDSPEFFTRMKKELGTDPFAEGGPYLVGLGVIAEEAGVEINFDESSTTGMQYDLAMGRPWTSDEAPLIKQWLVRNEKPLSTVLAGTRQPHYYRPMVGGSETEAMLTFLLPDIQQHREISRMLTARAMLALGENRPEEAIRDILAIHRLARHTAQGSTIIEMLVGIALESVAHGGDKQLANADCISADLLKDYSLQLSKLAPLANFSKAFEGERCFGLDIIQRMASSQLTPEEGSADLFVLLGVEFGSDVVSKLLSLFIQNSLDWNVVLIGINEYHDQVQLALAHNNFTERSTAMTELSEKLQTTYQQVNTPTNLALSVFATPEQRNKQMTTVLLGLLSPALEQIHVAGTRREAYTLLSEIGIATAAYQKSVDELPSSLNKLVPDYLSKLPNDPYTGKSFVYRVDDDGAIIYSLGKNLKDDGGTSIDDDRENHDHVFRVKRIEK